MAHDCQADNAIIFKHGNGASIIEAEASRYDQLPQTLKQIELKLSESPYPLGDVDVRLELLIGLASGLDRYSRVPSGDRLKSFDTRLKGTLVGIGATLRSTENQLVIVGTILGGPADLAGIQAGDVVERIGGDATINMPLREAIKKIQGERNTVLNLVLRRDWSCSS